jgi:hypothetical protein
MQHCNIAAMPHVHFPVLCSEYGHKALAAHMRQVCWLLLQVSTKGTGLWYILSRELAITSHQCMGWFLKRVYLCILCILCIPAQLFLPLWKRQ